MKLHQIRKFLNDNYFIPGITAIIINMLRIEDADLPIPITKSSYFPGFECCCKPCKWGDDRMHNEVGGICKICKIAISYNGVTCSLYSHRSPVIICFFCRLPYHKRGFSSAKIHHLLLPIYA